MTLPSLDSWTDPATMVTSDGGVGPAPPGGVGLVGEGDHAGVVGQPGDGQPGGGVPGPPGDPGPRGQAGLVAAQPLGVGGDHHPGVQDVDQAAATTASTGSPA